MATVVLGATLEELARNVANRRTVCAWIRSFGNTGALVRGPGRCPSAPLQRYPASGAALRYGEIRARREDPEQFKAGQSPASGAPPHTS